MDMRKAAQKKHSAAKPGRVTIDDLAVMMKDGFERLDNKIDNKVDGLRVELKADIKRLENGLFAVETKLDSVERRLTSIEKTVEPLTLSYHVFSHEIQLLDTRVTVLERKNGIQPE
jgi:hypothetical protein